MSTAQGARRRIVITGMGAITPITKYEPKARELAELLKRDKVDGVVLSPV